MPKQVDHEEQRARIRAAAIEVFGKQGIEGTGLAHVARAAQLSRPALYTYYTDKDALVGDLAGHLMAREIQLFQTVLAGPASAAERLDTLSDRLAALIQSESAGGSIMLQLWVTRPDLLRQGLGSLKTLLSPVIAEGQREGAVLDALDPDTLAQGLIALWDGLLMQACLAPGTLKEGRAQALSRAFLGRSVAP